MQGYRTIIANIVGLVVAILVLNGIEVPAKEQAEITAGLFAVLNLFMRVITTTPVGQSAPTDDIKPMNRQSGHSTNPFLVMLALLALLSLSACGTFKDFVKADTWQPFTDCANLTTVDNTTIGACYASVKILAANADAAADAGLLTKEQEHKFLDQLEEVTDFLSVARTFILDKPDNAAQQLQLAQNLLVQLSNQIPKPEQ